MNRSLALGLTLSLSCGALAQWIDVQKLGQGGETYVSTDGKGSVYATSHQPCKLYVSHDFGKTFANGLDLPDSMCDVTSTVGPDGKLYVIYIKPNVSGMQVVTLADGEKSVVKAGSISGSFDREWIVVHPTTGEIGFNYSNGYIGGPKSKGVFYALSQDKGATFKEISRIDKEPAGSYPIDPYLTIGSGGRIYAGWATSSDASKYDLIDKYMVATSDDGGRTWSNHAEMGSTHKAYGNTQERWMLGSLAAVGKDTAMMVYQDYVNLGIDGAEMRPLLAFYRVTNDGGKTWSSPKTCLSPKEIDQAMRAFIKGNGKSAPVKDYCQTLPWICSDAKGRVHLAFVDNRSGYSPDTKSGLWQVRFSTWTADKAGFSLSERVSHDWAAARPPLDFIGCCSDGANAWITWTENGVNNGWDFSGTFFVGHKDLKD